LRLEENGKNNAEKNIAKIDKQAGDGVGEGNEDEGGDNLGNGVLDTDNGLGGNLDAEHDHDTDGNEDDGRKDIDDVSECPPDGKNRLETLEANALGVGGFAKKTVFEAGKILDAGSGSIVEGSNRIGGGTKDTAGEPGEKSPILGDFTLDKIGGNGIDIDENIEKTSNIDSLRVDTEPIFQIVAGIFAVNKLFEGGISGKSPGDGKNQAGKDKGNKEKFSQRTEFGKNCLKRH